jgi:hypothetical protein
LDIVYASVQLNDQHPYQQMGVYNADKGQHEINFNATAVMTERIDGKYEITLYL